MISEHIADEERKKRLMAMGQMAATLAHEIRNPLGSVELYCSLLRKDLSQHPTAFQLVNEISKGIKTVDRIIGNCLQFARDVIPQKRTISDVPGFLRESISIISPQYQDLCSISCDPDQTILIDPYLMQQVIVNLVTNAIDATQEQGRTNPTTTKTRYKVRIQSTCIRAIGWTLSISDHGMGIPLDQLEQIFDPFYTTKPRGTGLGLCVVHSIVRAHGGSVSVTSAPGEGTTVTVTIPNDAPGEKL